MTLTVDKLAERIGARVRGDGSRVVERCTTLEAADERGVAFVATQRYARRIKDSAAGAIVVNAANAERVPQHMAALIADDPYLAFRNAVVELHGFAPQPGPGVSELACVDPSATVGEGAAILPFAYVSAGAKLGQHCVLYPNVFVGPDVTIGDDCVLYPGACVMAGCTIGDRVILQPGAVIGADGFGFATSKGVHHKIPHIGGVVIEDDVELGANTSVQSGSFDVTGVGRGTKMSDLVNVGHGAKVGPFNLIVSQVGIAGSAKTGSHVAIGGQTGLLGHRTVGDRARIAARSGVLTDIPADTEWAGSPALPLDLSKRVGLENLRLPDIAAELQQLREKVEALQAKLNGEVDSAND